MSKMMDNLARVRDEPAEAALPKPSLFVVKQQPVGSTVGSSGIPRGRLAAVWGVVALLLAGLGASFFYGQRMSDMNAVEQRIAAPDPSGAALDALREGRLSEAKTGLDQLLAAQPGQSAALANQAFVLRELGKIQEAETVLRSLLNKNPSHAVAHNNLGAIYLRTGRLPEAEISLRRAVALEPSLFEARINLAGVLELKRDWAGALRIFEEILDKNEAGEKAALLRERVRRLRSLAVASVTPKEAL